MNIIEELYQGMLCPIKVIIPKNEKLSTLDRKIGDEREYFAGLMPEVDKKRFQEWNELITKYKSMYEYANFEHGFRLGAKLTLETFCGERGQVENEEDQQSETDTESLLNVLADKRMKSQIDTVVENDQCYQSTLEEQDKAFSQMDSLIGTLDLYKQQKAVLDQAISANNAVGAAYGAAAYRLGLRDGIRLSAEMKAMKS